MEAFGTLGLIDAGFTRYQEQAQRTARLDLPHRDRLAVAALGLVGEAAEVSEKIKKFLGHGHGLDPLEVLEELGDVIWYVAEMTSLMGAELGVVAGMNIAKLRKRYPEGFSEDNSINRHKEIK
jgi:NTP pyrophosphatase (non-canonical NTP hydrolase)